MAKRPASRDSLNTRMPLAGKRIIITRTVDQSRSLVARLSELGAKPAVCPGIAIVPPESYDALDAAIGDLARYDWIIFASVNAVRAFAERFALVGSRGDSLLRLRIAAVGRATAEELSTRLRPPDFTPDVYQAEAVAARIGDVRKRRILIPSADIARDVLAKTLRERGADVSVVVAYRTVAGEGLAALAEMVRRRTADAILFASPSAVRYALQALIDVGITSESLSASTGRPAFMCIGGVTAAAAHKLRLPVDAVATEHTTDGLVAVVTDWFSSRNINVAT